MPICLKFLRQLLNSLCRYFVIDVVSGEEQKQQVKYTLETDPSEVHLPFLLQCQRVVRDFWDLPSEDELVDLWLVQLQWQYLLTLPLRTHIEDLLDHVDSCTSEAYLLLVLSINILVDLLFLTQKHTGKFFEL